MITSTLVTNGTLTVVFDNGAEIVPVRSDHPRWKDIIAAVSAKDEQTLRTLLSAKKVMEIYSNGDLTIDGTGVLYNGRPLHGVDVDRVLAFQRDGLPYEPIANYIRRCRANTSQRAIQELYPWLEHRQITLTPDGKFIGYKGVRNNFYSVYGNTETIVTSGTVDDEGHILNEIGKTIRVDRSCVSDDFRNPCGPGLHVGSLSYAKGWGQRVILVEVDPADVVSIPTDCDCQKLRCCGYKVIGEYTGPMPDTLSTEFSEDVCPQCGYEDCECDADEDNGGDDLMEGYTPTPSNEEMDKQLANAVLESHVKLAPDSLEQVAQDAGILPDEATPDDDENSYLVGMKDGIADKAKGVTSRYLSGDEEGADTASHAAYIEGYIDGYAD